MPSRRMDTIYAINSVRFENPDFPRNSRRNFTDCIKEMYNVSYNHAIYY